MVIDFTITIGNIVEIMSILIGGILVMVTLRGDVANMKTEVSEIQSEIKKIGQVLINQADQNRRIIRLEEDVRELRHGRGFIREAIEREYP